ncbi:MAG: hypothetical protein J6U35_03540, partial [Clostridia bacterium]|nr:hypothetical protein [Clostridia bacterium]
MKKPLGKIIAIIVSLVVSIGIFAGCDLIGVNTDKDMQQVIAKVQVAGAAEENVYKRELMNGYVSYGASYAQYGYTSSQIFDMILNNLVNNKVVVQYARLQLDAAEGKKYEHDDKVKGYLNLPEESLRTAAAKDRIDYIGKLLPYVTEVQIAKAAYSVKSNLNNIIDSLDDSKENKAKEKENQSVSARTVPTEKTVDGEVVDEAYAKATEGVEEDTLVDDLGDLKEDYDAWLIKKYVSYSMSANTSARKSAINSFIDVFKDESRGLISKEEYELFTKKGEQYNLNNYLYYIDLITANIESLLVSNYEELIEATAEEGITAEALWDEYVSAYKTQKSTYDKDYSAYESALENVTEDSFVFYNPSIDGAKYGYVANILIGFSDQASAALSAFKNKATTQAAIDEYREELLETLVAKDLRSTWLQSGYYMPEDKENKDGYAFGEKYVKADTMLKQFLGSYADNTDYTETEENYQYYFDDDSSEWTWGDKAEESFAAKFSDVIANEYVFDDFMKDIFGAVLGTRASASAEYPYEGQFQLSDEELADKILSKETLDKIDDLLFAFSTDNGSLNNYLGYLYSPKTSDGKYVTEFAEAAKYLVEEKGVGAYCVVATDFGYHIMVCTKVVDGSAGYYGNMEDEAEAKAQFIADFEVEGTVAYKFKEAKKSANVEKLVSDIVTYNISKFIDEDSKDYAVT